MPPRVRSRKKTQQIYTFAENACAKAPPPPSRLCDDHLSRSPFMCRSAPRSSFYRNAINLRILHVSGIYQPPLHKRSRHLKVPKHRALCVCVCAHFFAEPRVLCATKFAHATCSYFSFRARRIPLHRFYAANIFFVMYYWHADIKCTARIDTCCFENRSLNNDRNLVIPYKKKPREDSKWLNDEYSSSNNVLGVDDHKSFGLLLISAARGHSFRLHHIPGFLLLLFLVWYVIIRER